MTLLRINFSAAINAALLKLENNSFEDEVLSEISLICISNTRKISFGLREDCKSVFWPDSGIYGGIIILTKDYYFHRIEPTPKVRDYTPNDLICDKKYLARLVRNSLSRVIDRHDPDDWDSYTEDEESLLLVDYNILIEIKNYLEATQI